MLLELLGIKTYTITKESFKFQMINATADRQKKVRIKHPPFKSLIEYNSNAIKHLKVINKKGEDVNLKITPTIELKIKDVNGKNSYFLFDTVTLENGKLKGNKARMLNLFREINFDTVTEIKLRNSGKKIKYVA